MSGFLGAKDFGFLPSTSGGGGGGNAVIVLGGGTCSSVRCSVLNTASGAYSAAFGGCCNTASSNYSAILGGKKNNTSTFCDTFIIGSCLTASQACTTFVNCLSAANIPVGCAVCTVTNNVLSGYTPTYISGVHGSFYDTTTQTVPLNGIAAFKLNSTDAANTNGVSIQNNLSGFPTRITVTKTATYNLQFSAQLNRTSGGNPKVVHIWLRINNIDVPYTTTGLSVQANANKLVAAWNFYVRLLAGQYVEIMWTQDDAIDILYEPQNLTIPYPETPSVIVTINEV